MVMVAQTAGIGLNALTGIDWIWTDGLPAPTRRDKMGLNALTGIDWIWTFYHGQSMTTSRRSLNALTGIDWIWTCPLISGPSATCKVLMP